MPNFVNIADLTNPETGISNVSVSDLFGNCDYCKNKRYIGIYGKPCTVTEPCLHETGKKNWEHNGKFPNFLPIFAQNISL